MKTTGAGLAALGGGAFLGRQAMGETKHLTAREYLADRLYTRQEVEDWFAGKAFPFAKYDAELGWLHRDGIFNDGIEGSACIYTYEENPYHERLMIRYADKPCRINTYGDSFTKCHQVSDGETWQEVLAAHLQEPVRNFGIGGWSVYQAYRRMLREEKRCPAELLVLNIYDDDHYRNLDSWRNLRARKHPHFIEPTLPYLSVNLTDQTCTQNENPCPTEESFYNLCDLDWVYNRFKDDFVLNILLAHENAKSANPDLAYKAVMALAETHGINTDFDALPTASEAARELHTKAALFSTMRIVEWVEDFARNNNKKVFYVLSFSPKTVARWLDTGERFDQPFVDFLKQKELPVVDLLEAHATDYAQFNIPVKQYLSRYYIGHYNPLGNHFTAFAIRNQVKAMLDPKPRPYRP